MPNLSPPSEVLYVESVDQAATLLKPQRARLLRRMAEPITCTELAESLGVSPQKVHYHVKALEQAGLVTRTGERPARGFVEAIYQAAARAYWFAPHLVRRLGGSGAAKDQASLAALCGHAEEMLHDVGRLAQRSRRGDRIPSLSLNAEIELSDPARRAAFVEEVTKAFQAIATAYGARESSARGNAFRMTLACYPAPEAGPASSSTSR